MLNEMHNNVRRGNEHRRKALFPRFSPTASWTDTLDPGPTDQPNPPAQNPPAQQQPPSDPPPNNQPAQNPPANQQPSNPPANPPSDPPQNQPAGGQNPPASSGGPGQSSSSSGSPPPSSTSSTPPASNTSTTPTNTPTPTPPPQQQPNKDTDQKDTQGPATPPPSHPASSPSASPTGGRGANIASPSISPTPSTTAAPSGGVSTPVVIGGVVAGIVGVAGIIFAVLYFLRRQRRDDDAVEEFQPDNFRRQSVLLPDTDGNAPTRGMSMRQNDSDPYGASYAQRAHPYSQASYQDSPLSPQFSNGAYYGYEAQGHSSFSPGQVVPMGQALHVNANVPPAGNPFFSPIGESPMTPTSAPPDTAHAEEAALMRQSSMTQNSQFITRQSSVTQNSQFVTRQPYGAPAEFAPPENDYVDLSRSSVTPFQAAQYAEISRRLNTDAPGPMPTPVLASVAENVSSEDYPAPPKTMPTPPLEVGQTVAVGRLSVRNPNEHAMPESPFADPEHTRTSTVDPDDDGMPQPPSPAFSSNSRVTSTPPVLPEISVPQRAFSPISHEPIGGAQFAPSPLANTVTLPAEAHLSSHHGNFADVPKTPTVESPPVTPRPHVTEAKRPETLYDDDDAYGGI